MNKSHLNRIKAAQTFEFIGEIMCLVGASFIMAEAIQDNSLNLLFGSFFVAFGNVSMIVQSIMTINIPEDIKENDDNKPYNNIKKRKNTDDTESV